MILTCLGLGTTGVFLGFSIIAAFLNTGIAISFPGDFFIRSYGFLAFVIPAYLLYAAFLLADPEYKPQSIFLLGAFMVPFLLWPLAFTGSANLRVSMFNHLSSPEPVE